MHFLLQWAIGSWSNDRLFSDHRNAWNVIRVRFKYINALANGRLSLCFCADLSVNCSLFCKFIIINISMTFELNISIIGFRFPRRRYGCYQRIERPTQKKHYVGCVVGFNLRPLPMKCTPFNATVSVQKPAICASNKIENVHIHCQQWSINSAS